MKKTAVLSAVLASSLAVSSLGFTVNAADSVNVCVTISDSEGELVLAQEEVEVSDVDGDGAITVNDALFTAHEEFYEGGAEDGYLSEETQYGLTLSMLWGTENGGSYGYYVNNAPSMSLADEIEDGDFINAFVYTDTTTWSDKYCYFDCNEAEVETDEEISITLYSYEYDANWQPYEAPYENAVITVNGEDTDITTDEEGTAAFSFTEGGTYLISARSDDDILVPPVCFVYVEGEESEDILPAETQTSAEDETEEETETTAVEETEKSESSETTAPPKTTAPAGSGKSTDSPKTGDSAAGIAVAAAAAVCGMVLSLKRKND